MWTVCIETYVSFQPQFLPKSCDMFLPLDKLTNIMQALGFWNFSLNSSLNISQAVNHSKVVLIGRYTSIPYTNEATKTMKNHVITDFRSAFMNTLLWYKRGWRSVKHNSSNIKHLMWYWGYMFRLYWVIFRFSCTRSILTFTPFYFTNTSRWNTSSSDSVVNVHTLGADRNGTLLLHISRWSLNYALFTWCHNFLA